MPAENKCVPSPTPVLGEEQLVLRCPLCIGCEEKAERPTEKPARPPFKRKGLDCGRVSWEDEPTKAVPCRPPHRLSSADHSLCRQVYAAVADVLQEAMAAKRRTGERRNSFDEKASLDAPSLPSRLLYASELHDSIGWAEDEVRDYDPAYLPTLHRALHALIARRADPLSAGPQLRCPLLDPAAVPAPCSRGALQPLTRLGEQSQHGSSGA